MSLASLVRGGVALAHRITRDGELQETVTWKRWSSQDGYGKPVYAAALTPSVLVSHSSKRIRLASGEETVSTDQVTFLEPPAALTATGRQNLVDKRDLFAFSDGRTGQILRIDDGLTDVATGLGFVVQVFLG